MTITLQQFENGEHFIRIPKTFLDGSVSDTQQRLKCRLNDRIEFLSEISAKEDGHYIQVGEKISESLNIKPGDNLSVRLEPEIVPFSYPMPEVLKEVLSFLPEVHSRFHKLTLGRQRTYIYLIQTTHSVGMKWERSRLIAQQIKLGLFEPWKILQ